MEKFQSQSAASIDYSRGSNRLTWVRSYSETTTLVEEDCDLIMSFFLEVTLRE